MITLQYQAFESGFLKHAHDQGTDPAFMQGYLAELGGRMQKWAAAYDEIERETGDRNYRVKLAAELVSIYPVPELNKQAAAEWLPIIQQWLSDPNNRKLLMTGGGGMIGALLGKIFGHTALGAMLGGAGGFGLAQAGVGEGLYQQGGYMDQVHRNASNTVNQQRGTDPIPAGAEQNLSDRETADPKQIGVPADMSTPPIPGPSTLANTQGHSAAAEDANFGVPQINPPRPDVPGPMTDKQQQVNSDLSDRQQEQIDAGYSDEAELAELAAATPRASSSSPPITPPVAGGGVEERDPVTRWNEWKMQKDQYDQQLNAFNDAEAQRRKTGYLEKQHAQEQDTVLGVNLSKGRPTDRQLSGYGPVGGKVKGLVEDTVRGGAGLINNAAGIGAAGIEGGLQGGVNAARAVGNVVTAPVRAAGEIGGLIGDVGGIAEGKVQGMAGEAGLWMKRNIKTPPPAVPRVQPPLVRPAPFTMPEPR